MTSMKTSRSIADPFNEPTPCTQVHSHRHGECERHARAAAYELRLLNFEDEICLQFQGDRVAHQIERGLTL